MDSTQPSLLLRRAENILTSTGQVQPAFKELESVDGDVPLSESPVSLRRSLNASIKRKLGVVKDAAGLGRSLTLGSRKAVGSSRAEPPGRQVRSFSESCSESPFAKGEIFENSTAVVESDVPVPTLLLQGTPMTKVTERGQSNAVFRVDPDLGQIIWESKKHRIIPLESIKELRSGSDARYYREQFQLTQEYESRWLTIVYVVDRVYKTLHLIAATQDVFHMWNDTLQKLYAIRKKLMSGLCDRDLRDAIWEKHYWKGSDEEGDNKLSFQEVEKLCKRLAIYLTPEELQRLFKHGDKHNRNYLDFEDFRRFVKLLKSRPEIDRIYNKLRNGRTFNFAVFEKFMRETQESTLTKPELRNVFERYSILSDDTPSIRTMTSESFASFLMSHDNSVFMDQQNKITHDMTRPLSDYYISSSHNTYLVGHQLVGESTIEGYIRALLLSCRSVELDIYADPSSSPEPMITHGGTLTSKLPLRDVCTAIAQYGFAMSPYPIIISAEMHCTLAGQEAVVKILHEVFGDMLVRREEGDRCVVEKLPSPEELKGKILFKTKNLDLSQHKSTSVDYGTDAVTSASDSDTVIVVHHPGKRRRSTGRLLEADTVKEFKEAVLQRVRSVGRSHSRSPHQPSLPLPGSPPHSNQNSPGPTLLPLPVPFTPSSSRSPSSPSTPLTSPSTMSASDPPAPTRTKTKMSPALLEILVYTVGVKFRGINKKEVYAPEQMFSLSETVANSLLKSPSDSKEPNGIGNQSRKRPTSIDGAAMNVRFEEGRLGGGDGGKSKMYNLVKHCRSHLVRVYPKGTRVNSTNYEPHRYWSAGAQLVAINWQTCDLGYVINHAMFQRNGRAGYVLKPPALRASSSFGVSTKELLSRRRQHYLDVKVISAQQLSRTKDGSGREMVEKTMMDPFVEVFVHVPEWPAMAPAPAGTAEASLPSSPPPLSSGGGDGPRSPPLSPRGGPKTVSYRTNAVKNNGFNPVWEERLRIPFECVGDMLDLVFVRFVVRQEDREVEEPLGAYCASLGSLGRGYRHLPLHDAQLSQYLFSTLFIQINIMDT